MGAARRCVADAGVAGGRLRGRRGGALHQVVFRFLEQNGVRVVALFSAPEGDPAATQVGRGALRHDDQAPRLLRAGGLRQLAAWLAERSTYRHDLFRAVSYPFTLMITGALIYSVVFHGFVMPVVMDALTS